MPKTKLSLWPDPGHLGQGHSPGYCSWVERALLSLQEVTHRPGLVWDAAKHCLYLESSEATESDCFEDPSHNASAKETTRHLSEGRVLWKGVPVTLSSDHAGYPRVSRAGRQSELIIITWVFCGKTLAGHPKGNLQGVCIFISTSHDLMK